MRHQITAQHWTTRQTPTQTAGADLPKKRKGHEPSDAHVPSLKGEDYNKLLDIEQIVVFLAFLNEDAAAGEDIAGTETAVLTHLGLVD